jgi:iron complex outermembrane receptor protein
MLVTYQIFGDQNLEEEDLHAYELGWRWRPLQTVAVDIALYRNEYERLIAGQPLPPVLEMTPTPRMRLPAQFVNLGETSSEGAELALEWIATDWMQIEAQGTWQARSGDVGRNDRVDPKRIFNLRAMFDLPYDTELDLDWRSVSDITRVKGYQAFNARLGWWPTPSLEVSFSIDNLFDDEHVESFDDIAIRPGARLGRSAFARFTVRPKR